ncbi:MAG TPA: hypothetical protein ENI23_13660 [bacterium]|nr:hypothetical protein [bacterium]
MKRIYQLSILVAILSQWGCAVPEAEMMDSFVPYTFEGLDTILIESGPKPTISIPTQYLEYVGNLSSAPGTVVLRKSSTSEGGFTRNTYDGLRNILNKDYKAEASPPQYTNTFRKTYEHSETDDVDFFSIIGLSISDKEVAKYLRKDIGFTSIALNDESLNFQLLSRLYNDYIDQKDDLFIVESATLRFESVETFKRIENQRKINIPIGVATVDYKGSTYTQEEYTKEETLVYLIVRPVKAYLIPDAND